jgi:hypothetical protein
MGEGRGHLEETKKTCREEEGEDEVDKDHLSSGVED